jgi:hypothetical protein
MEENKIKEITVLQKFDGLSFLSKIENAETISKKFNIMNEALNQDVLVTKNMKAELAKNGINGSKSTDYDYVPIGVVEECLRQVFFRQVDFEITNTYRDLNSFVVTVRIHYKCPISGEKRFIDGIGAKALQQESGSKIYDFNSTMKSNALELGVGNAYSIAIKNASKKLGILFGGELNRDEELTENLNVFSEKVTNKPAYQLKEIKKLFNEKKGRINPNEIPNFDRIIENEERLSYEKVLKYLKRL